MYTDGEIQSASGAEDVLNHSFMSCVFERQVARENYVICECPAGTTRHSTGMELTQPEQSGKWRRTLRKQKS